ncbi:hypothetical protein MESS2_310020 [Mesorhizobium metallidurans STM 2683]|uniref:Solute-binding protein family 3/N-terminal domain-containing protein n=2 Tax=Mesorhizobium metallidurans TaxID=489722 RepID=M5EQL7_9HYPH|nr:hypothetical protein MESS2_310020 [Mesorhizobium metallidurans STM 2683]
MGIAVKKGNTELLDRLKNELQALVASKEYDAILAKYNLALPSEEEIAKSLSE